MNAFRVFEVVLSEQPKGCPIAAYLSNLFFFFERLKEAERIGLDVE